MSKEDTSLIPSGGSDLVPQASGGFDLIWSKVNFAIGPKSILLHCRGQVNFVSHEDLKNHSI
jgi:hypothetical protein